MAWYIALVRIDEKSTFLFVVDNEQITHTAVISTEDATTLHEQLERGDNTAFSFSDDVGAEISLPLDYTTPLFYDKSQGMKKFIKRLAKAQASY